MENTDAPQPLGRIRRGRVGAVNQSVRSWL